MNTHHKEFVRTIQQLTQKYRLWDIYSDFVHLAAISLYNSIHHDPEEEDRYLKIAARYTRDEMDDMCKLLSHTVHGLDNIGCDFLGEVFMDLELGNKWAGQFFTPFSVSKMMSEMQLGEGVKNKINEHGYTTVSDPAVGAGSTIIGFASSMLEQGINYQQCLHATVTDVDHLAFCMCYIQLSLLHVPALVIHGNTLTLQNSKVWRTPAHVLGNWDFKLASDKSSVKVKEQSISTSEAAA